VGTLDAPQRRGAAGTLAGVAVRGYKAVSLCKHLRRTYTGSHYQCVLIYSSLWCITTISLRLYSIRHLPPIRFLFSISGPHPVPLVDVFHLCLLPTIFPPACCSFSASDSCLSHCLLSAAYLPPVIHAGCIDPVGCPLATGALYRPHCF
jgi:hypothetical protein